MQLNFFILVLCSYIQYATSNQPDSSWRPSRYIIDNRRNVLFSKKLLPSPIDLRFNEPLKQKLYPVERYQKDLTAEASISEPNFFRKYAENSLPRKIIKAYKITNNLGGHEYNGIFESQKNTTGVLDPHNFIQNEDEVLNDVSKVVTTVSVTPSTPTTPKDVPKDVSPQTGFDFGLPTTTTYPWEITKTDEVNQIDEKHVYETRIETVSYHQEVIFNPPKKQWYQEEEKQTEKNYEQPEENYEEPEKNYEVPEKNYEEPEKNYEVPEKNYEEPEKNYELDEAMNVMPEEEDKQNKFGYVVEGTNYKKYRVEERTPDGFIVGEYGVVSHDDGSLRGVRYTADGDTNPKLIYETLIKFLSL